MMDDKRTQLSISNPLSWFPRFPTFFMSFFLPTLFLMALSWEFHPIDFTNHVKSLRSPVVQLHDPRICVWILKSPLFSHQWTIQSHNCNSASIFSFFHPLHLSLATILLFLFQNHRPSILKPTNSNRLPGSLDYLSIPFRNLQITIIRAPLI